MFSGHEIITPYKDSPYLEVIESPDQRSLDKPTISIIPTSFVYNLNEWKVSIYQVDGSDCLKAKIVKIDSQDIRRVDSIKRGCPIAFNLVRHHSIAYLPVDIKKVIQSR